MSFAQPQILTTGFILLLCMIVFVIWSGRRTQAAMARLGSPQLMQRLSEAVNKSGRAWKTRLWFVSLVLLVVAMARPLWGSEVQMVEQQGIQIILALDVSPSMLTEDVKPNRLTRAKLEISDMFDHLNGDEVGLVLFSGASFVQFPLTTDYTTALSFIDAANPAVISKPGTSIGEAIRTAMKAFDEKRASQKVIILFTDGEDHEADSRQAATEAAELDIIIYTVGIGTNQGEPIPELDDQGNVSGYKKDRNGEIILSKLDTAALQEIAAITGGKFYLTNASGSEIEALVSEMDKLQQDKLESQFEIIGIERFQLFLLAALACLIAMELIPERVSNRRLVKIHNHRPSA